MLFRSADSLAALPRQTWRPDTDPSAADQPQIGEPVNVRLAPCRRCMTTYRGAGTLPRKGQRGKSNRHHGYRRLRRMDSIQTLAWAAGVHRTRDATGDTPSEPGARGLCTWQHVFVRGKICRSGRRLSPGTRVESEASPCRGPTCRSRTAAAGGCRHNARQLDRLSHPQPVLPQVLQHARPRLSHLMALDS